MIRRDMDFLRMAVELASPVHGSSVGVDVGECNGVTEEGCAGRLDLFGGFAAKLDGKGNRNPTGHGSTTIGDSDWTVIAGELRLIGALPGESAARARMAPSEADDAFEMWGTGLTSYNTAVSDSPDEF
jgi:hypothetical protein